MAKSSKPRMRSFSDVLEAAGARPSPDSPAAAKNRYAVAFANSMAVLIANALRPHFPGIKPEKGAMRF